MIKKMIRQVIHHLPSGALYESKGFDWDKDSQEALEDLVERLAKLEPGTGACLTIETSNGSKFVIPKKVLDECILKVEVYEHNTEHE